MKKLSITCFLAIAFAAGTLAQACAQGKSAASNGQGGGSLNAHLGSDASSTASSSDSQPSGTMDLGTGTVGTYGQLGASHSIDLGDSMSLQLNGGADFDQQSKTDPGGALNGRVGLGWKY